PVMDGVTATREIRKLPSLQRLPIVAMTANAMEQDRRKSMDAGMNDFLVKPIDPEDMWTVLLRWVRPPRTTAAPSPAAQLPKPTVPAKAAVSCAAGEGAAVVRGGLTQRSSTV